MSKSPTERLESAVNLARRELQAKGLNTLEIDQGLESAAEAVKPSINDNTESEILGVLLTTFRQQMASVVGSAQQSAHTAHEEITNGGEHETQGTVLNVPDAQLLLRSMLIQLPVMVNAASMVYFQESSKKLINNAIQEFENFQNNLPKVETVWIKSVRNKLSELKQLMKSFPDGDQTVRRERQGAKEDGKTVKINTPGIPEKEQESKLDKFNRMVDITSDLRNLASQIQEDGTRRVPQRSSQTRRTQR